MRSYKYQESIPTDGVTIVTQHSVPDTVAQIAKILKANLIAAGLKEVEVEVYERRYVTCVGDKSFIYTITVGGYDRDVEIVHLAKIPEGLPDRLRSNYTTELNGIPIYHHRVLRYMVGEVYREVRYGDT